MIADPVYNIWYTRKLKARLFLCISISAKMFFAWEAAVDIVEQVQVSSEMTYPEDLYASSKQHLIHLAKEALHDLSPSHPGCNDISKILGSYSVCDRSIVRALFHISSRVLFFLMKVLNF